MNEPPGARPHPSEARRRQVFVHVGTHKTGSTSIQNFLARNADRLRAGGILVPTTGIRGYGHHLVAWELRHDERLGGRSGFVPGLLEELRGSDLDRAVISSEDFEYLSRYRPALASFTSSLRSVGFEPVFVVFFREPEAYLASLAAELAKHGVAHPMEWYRGQLHEHGSILVRDDWFFDFDRERFVAAFRETTAAGIVTLDYDACAADDGIVPRFLRVIGASEELVAAGRSWPRLNVRA